MRDTQDQTPLHKLSAYNARDCAKVALVLLDAGAQTNIVDMHGSTPITFAIKNDNKELLKMLDPNDTEQAQLQASLVMANGSGIPLNKRAMMGDREPPTKRLKISENLGRGMPPMVTTISIKCKYGQRVKMIKVEPRTITARELILQVLSKFEIYTETPKVFEIRNYSRELTCLSEETDVEETQELEAERNSVIKKFFLQYVDEEGDEIDLADQEDLQIFLGNPKIKKLLSLKENQWKEDRRGSGT
eukprot:TRINITY_DN8084_c0_g2_i2.p1 TRINITY_DN8084_c0_g2~~TRINITY_DN8084_c0_g2_i2.p1  ORF type:complete len:269 (-),score=68.91 TRINITY_DN8084_c0_g2_i2:178-915(-)